MTPVLVTGESGTGKELLARGLHALGPQPNGPFVAVNCGALPRELAESELFGHERGSFTGAGARRPGWFEEASGGTLVLDEIGELPLDLQPKLLRVLESGRLRRIGGTGEVAVRARIVAMTLRNLEGEVQRRTFRPDLYYRLAGICLRLPPLRERRADIPKLAQRFLAEIAAEVGPRELDEGALAALMKADWPGNVRELRNVVRRAAILTRGHPERRITADALELPRQSGPFRLAEGGRSNRRPRRFRRRSRRTPFAWTGAPSTRSSARCSRGRCAETRAAGGGRLARWPSPAPPSATRSAATACSASGRRLAFARLSRRRRGRIWLLARLRGRSVRDRRPGRLAFRPRGWRRRRGRRGLLFRDRSRRRRGRRRRRRRWRGRRRGGRRRRRRFRRGGRSSRRHRRGRRRGGRHGRRRERDRRRRRGRRRTGCDRGMRPGPGRRRHHRRHG